MTPEELDELEKLCAAATPGPWQATKNGWVTSKDGPLTDEGFIINQAGDIPGGWSDTEFIAAARSALPRLLAAYRAVAEENARLKAEARLPHSNYADEL